MKLKDVVMFIWQLPQIIIGLLKTIGMGRYVHMVDGVRIYISDGMDGMSLGNVIIINPNVPEGTWLVKHEFGHVIQSRILGWLYIPVIFIPSYLWYCFICFIERKYNIDVNSILDLYYKFYTELWANRLFENRRKR